MLKGTAFISMYLGLFFGDICTATGVAAVTLGHELSSLMKDHPLVISHQQKVLAADADISVAMDNYFPILDISTEVGQQKYKDTGAGTDSDLNNNRYSLSLSQNLFKGFKDQAKVNEVRTKMNIAETTLNKIKQRLTFEAGSTYLDVLHYYTLSELINENVNLSRQFVKKREEQRETGDGNHLNVYNAQLTLQRSLEQKLMIDGRKRISLGKYQTVFFHTPVHNEMKEPPLINNLLPATLPEAIVMAKNNNLNISIAQDRVEQAKYFKEGAHGEYWPSLNLKGSYNFERNYQGVEGTKKDTRVDLKLHWKFNLGNDIGDKFRSANNNFAAEKYSYQSTIKDIDGAVNQSWEKLHTLRIRSKLAQETVEIAEKLFQASQELKQKGSGSDIGLLNSKVRLLDTQIALLNAQHEFTKASYELGYVCGLLSPDLFGE